VIEQQQNITARMRATIEEELGTFRHFAAVPSAEIEEMARRLVRTILPVLGLEETESRDRAA
jgi:hypothetical protein